MHLPLSLLLFLMENSCLLIPLVGKSLLLPITVPSYLGTFDLASLHFDPGGYLSGGFGFDPGGSHSHRFLQSTSALSSGETIGHQHPLFPSDLTKCTAFFKALSSSAMHCSIPCMMRKEKNVPLFHVLSTSPSIDLQSNKDSHRLISSSCNCSP